jgi:hypothetical protein
MRSPSSNNTSPIPTHLAPPPALPQLFIHPSDNSPSPQQGNDSGPDMPIPEIRLAPPMMEQNRTPSINTPYYSARGDPQRLPSPNNASSLRLISPSHSFASTNTNDDCFVSARQSPELVPTSFDNEHSPTKLSTTHNDDHGDDDDDENKMQFDTINNNNNNNSNNNNNHLSLTSVLFPTLQEWSSKSWFSRLSSLVAMPLVLAFTLTLPVAESEDVKIDQVEVMDDDLMYHPHYSTTNHSPASATPYGSVHHIQPMLNSGDKYHLSLPLEQPHPSSFLTVPPSDSDFHLGQQQKQQHPHSSDIKHAHSVHSSLDITDADLQQGWCRWLLAVQSVFGTTFIFYILACK